MYWKVYYELNHDNVDHLGTLVKKDAINYNYEIETKINKKTMNVTGSFEIMYASALLL